MQLTSVIQVNYLTITFQGFCLPLRNSYFKEQLFCVTKSFSVTLSGCINF